MRIALVIIDMQKQFLPADTVFHPNLGEAIELINHVAVEFRRAGLPVIWVQDAETLDESHPGFPMLEGLDVAPGDRRLTKVASNAYLEPALPGALESAAADFVLFAGYRAEQCVLATVRGAADRGQPHAVLRGSILSPDPEAASFVERISPLMSHEVATALAQSVAPTRPPGA